jgi:hypothetical protein
MSKVPLYMFTPQGGKTACEVAAWRPPVPAEHDFCSYPLSGEPVKIDRQEVLGRS